MTLREALRAIADQTGFLSLSGGNFGDEDNQKYLECTVAELLAALKERGIE